jgi:hypothetical protein
VTEQAGLSGGNDARTGVHARPAQQPDPLVELRGDLALVLKVLEATTPAALVMLGRKRGNRFAHALEAARRELRRALAATDAGSGA